MPKPYISALPAKWQSSIANQFGIIVIVENNTFIWKRKSKADEG
jgi:hypothetical protein